MKLSLTITGMHCESCVTSVRAALDNIANVEIDDVVVGSACVRFDEAIVSKNALLTAVRQAGSFDISSFQANLE